MLFLGTRLGMQYTCSVAVENVARKLPLVASSGQFDWLTRKKTNYQ